MAPVPPRRRAVSASLGFAVAGALICLPLAAGNALADGKSTQPSAAGPNLSYVVNTQAGNGPLKAAERAVRAADGTVVTGYPQIGVVVAHSANPGFAAAIRAVHGIKSAGATRTSPLQAAGTDETGQPQTIDAGSAAALAAKQAHGSPDAAGDPLEPLQWDMRAIKADQAHDRTLGSSKVHVGIVDTGVDDTHPDLAANFDAKDSVNCVGGKADTTAGAWRPTASAPDSYHGTHVAGTIAAARNGIGITGVAPGVRISAIKVAESDTSLFYPESIVCGFMWAAGHGIDVTNNSYYIDPWYFNCTTDPDQKAIVDAVGKATAYAQRKGTLTVAAAGNDNFDLASHAITDTTSPDDGTPVSRTVDPAVCPDLPVQLPGVVGVAATGAQSGKSSFSNYGLGVIDVAAPGGDGFQVPDPPATNGDILSTLPGNQYGYLAGTSMATPHVVGVAALLKSTHPRATPAQLQELLERQADSVACPAAYDPDGDGTVDAVCQGGKNHNAFYGDGIVDALKATR
jgi:subtilisin family serine protease